MNVWDVWPWSPRLFYGLAMQGVLVVSLPVADPPARLALKVRRGVERSR